MAKLTVHIPPKLARMMRKHREFDWHALTRVAIFDAIWAVETGDGVEKLPAEIFGGPHETTPLPPGEYGA